MGKVLRESIATFYDLHHDKGKFYTFEHFKNMAEQRSVNQKTQAKDPKYGYRAHYQNV